LIAERSLSFAGVAGLAGGDEIQYVVLSTLSHWVNVINDQEYFWRGATAVLAPKAIPLEDFKAQLLGEADAFR
jgi:hypothetical protein